MSRVPTLEDLVIRTGFWNSCVLPLVLWRDQFILPLFWAMFLHLLLPFFLRFFGPTRRWLGVSGGMCPAPRATVRMSQRRETQDISWSQENYPHCAHLPRAMACVTHYRVAVGAVAAQCILWRRKEPEKRQAAWEAGRPFLREIVIIFFLKAWLLITAFCLLGTGLYFLIHQWPGVPGKSNFQKAKTM